MSFRESSVRSHRPPAVPPAAPAFSSSLGAVAALPAAEPLPAAPAPTISTVCVDVRELLRQATEFAAAAPLSPPSSGAARTAGSSGDKAGALPPMPWRPPAQTRPRAAPQPPREGAPFWAPSYPPMGGFAVHSGPPPLSPTDATVVRSILGKPSAKRPVPAAVDIALPPALDRSQGRGNNSSNTSGCAPTRRPSQYHGRPTSTHRSSATSSALPRDESSLGWVASVDVGDGHPTPRSSLAAAVTSPPSPHLSGVAALWSEDRGLVHTEAADAADAADTAVAVSNLSPVAQRTVHAILGQLRDYSAAFAAPGSTARTALPASASSRGTTVSPTRAPQGVSSASEAGPRIGGDAAVGNGDAGAMTTSSYAAATTTGAAAAPARPSVRELWRRCPGLAAATFRSLDAETPAAAKRTDSGAVARPRGLAYHKPNASAPAAYTGQTGLTPRRTVPPAFQRQLLFSEAAPTTRRPKRK